MRFLLHFFAKCIFYMFELREKFEKSNFLAILTPDKRNLVGPRRPSGQFSEIGVPTRQNPNFGKIVHCILPLHCFAVLIFRNSGSNLIEPDFRKSCPLHEAIILALENWSVPRQNPDFGISHLWNPDSGKLAMTPKTAKFCGQKSGNECQNKKSFPESILTRTFCKKRDPNWPFLASTAPFTIYHPPIGGHHRVLYFTTQMTEKYSTAMC